MFFELLKTLSVLALVLGLIFLLAYVGKRFGLRRQQGGQNEGGWRVLAVKSLGARRQVFIVEVGSRLLLVGVTDKMMTPLMEISDEKERNTIVESVEKSGQNNVFAAFLKRAEA